MAEICSVYPSAGSVYTWTGLLCPNRRWAPVLSYICAWFNMIGNVASDSSFAYGMCQVISASMQLVSNGESRLTTEAEVILSISVLIIWAVKNRLKLDQQGWFNNASAVYQFISTVFIALVIVVASPKLSDSQFVFTRFENRTGFKADGVFNISYICIMGVLMSLYGLSGYESGATLSEETANPEVSAPQGMVNAVVASVFTGLIFIIGLLYACQGSVDQVLAGLTDQAVVNIFSITFEGQTLMPQLLTVTLLLNIFLCGFSHMTVTTRITYALVRDGALPGSSWLNYLNPVTSNPDRVLSLVLLLDSALCLLPLLSTTAFTAITQITTIGYQISYAMPIALWLYNSGQGHRVGKWNIGRWSRASAAIALAWLVVTSAVLFFPQKVDPKTGE